MLKLKQIRRGIIGQVKEQVNFWQDKTPCWELCHCPEVIKSQCPASRYPSLPCWEIEGTYLKLDEAVKKGDDNSICRVYKKYGEGKPVRIRLRGKGLDTHYRVINDKCNTRLQYGGD